MVRALALTVMRVMRLHSESCGVFAGGGTREDMVVGSCSYVERGEGLRMVGDVM